MLRKYALIASALTVFLMPFKAQAQTMDIIMKIQTLLDQLSEVRAALKQAQSSLNIETMSQNLFGNLQEMASNAGSQLLGGGAGGGGDEGGNLEEKEKVLLVLPDDLAEKLDDPDAQIAWFEDNLLALKDFPTLEEKDEMLQKQKDFRYTAVMSAFSEAMVLRKKIDENVKSVKRLKFLAENSTSEMDFHFVNSRLAALKHKQAQKQELISAIEMQMQGAYKMTPVDKKMAENLKGREEVGG